MLFIYNFNKFFLINYCLILICVGEISGVSPVVNGNDGDDNEFAEFEYSEEFTLDDEVSVASKAISDSIPNLEENVVTVEDDGDDEFLIDDEEFERVEVAKDSKNEEFNVQPTPLKFSEIPAHFRFNWASYQVEALFITIIGIYMLNYGIGRSRNQMIANAWFQSVSPLLKEQFTVVGDDGVSEEPAEDNLIKETDSSYQIWCTGRASCQGMLIQLRLQKRQDLMHVIMDSIRPRQDKAVIRIHMDANELDSFVLAFGQRKSVAKAAKELTDLSMYTIERKGLEKIGLPSSMAVYAEISEAVFAIIDPTVQCILRKYESAIDYFHFSDQYSGVKPAEGETYTRLPGTSQALIFSINIGNDSAVTEAIMKTIFYCIEKLRRYRLSKEGKAKADKKRQSVKEVFMKATHQVRQEAAQARREEKNRERKQKLLDEEDPEKQRRLEKLEQKRDSKMRQPKIKQLKVK